MFCYANNSRKTYQRKDLEEAFKKDNQSILIILEKPLSIYAMTENIKKVHSAINYKDTKDEYVLSNSNKVLILKLDDICDFGKFMVRIAGMNFTHTYGTDMLPAQHKKFLKTCMRWDVYPPDSIQLSTSKTDFKTW